MSFALKETSGAWIFDESLKGLADHFVYLVREPNASVKSFQRVARKLNDPKYYVKKDFGYEDLLALKKAHPGPLILSEKFMEDPHETLEGLFSTLSLDFEPVRSLQWDPVEQEKLPEQFKAWYEDVATSTGIVPKKASEVRQDSPIPKNEEIV